MIAFKIRVNGKHIVTAGQDDWSILTSHITASRDNDKLGVEDYVRLSTHGLSKTNEEGISQHFRWSGLDLKLGVKVEIEVIDTDNIEEPKKRYRSDKEVRESPFTEEEWRDLRYKDYLELKKEFEENEGA